MILLLHINITFFPTKNVSNRNIFELLYLTGMEFICIQLRRLYNDHNLTSSVVFAIFDTIEYTLNKVNLLLSKKTLINSYITHNVLG